MPAEESCARKFCRGIRRCTATEAPAYDHDRQIQKSSGGIRMLEFCVKQNVFLYAMIAAGIAGVWCLFWNNRFYTRAIRDLGRLKEPKSKWTRSVLETCQRKAHPFSNAGAFMRSQIAQGRSAGMAVPTLLRGSQNMILTVLALSILSLWAIYRYRYGEAELMRYLGTGIALAGGLVFFRLCLDFGGKEEILLNGWTDYLENEFAAMKQSAVLETVQQTERQPVQAEAMAQAGTGAAKTKTQTAGSESAKERNELFADPEKEARISKVREGIRQTAAAESRFAGMLTPEEEKLMREIISEYV